MWHNLIQQFHLLGRDLRAQKGRARDVSPGSLQARHQPGAYRVADPDHHDRDGRRGLLGRHGCRRADRHDRARLEVDQLCGQRGEPLALAFVKSALESDVPAFDPSVRPKLLDIGRNKASKAGVRGPPIEIRPIRWIFPGCCALAASGMATTAESVPYRNTRRFSITAPPTDGMRGG
jgi:hypothetical protein